MQKTIKKSVSIRSIMTTLIIYRKGCCPRTARLTAAK